MKKFWNELLAVLSRMKLLCAVVVCVIIAQWAVAQPRAVKYWQDIMMQPDQAWKESYNRDMPEVQALTDAIENVFRRLSDNDSQESYNIAKLIGAVKAQAGAIGLLKEEIAAVRVELESIREPKTIDGAVDPNETP